ncbi:hypothetical protein ACTMU2_41545 [Cupriavidus basilensis]
MVLRGATLIDALRPPPWGLVDIVESGTIIDIVSVGALVCPSSQTADLLKPNSRSTAKVDS